MPKMRPKALEKSPNNYDCMKHLLTIFMLLFYYMLCSAQVPTLIVDNKVAGTLSQRVLYEDQQTIQNLIIIGEINADDIVFLQELNRQNNLIGIVDLSGANIVSGGSYQINNTYLSTVDSIFNVRIFSTDRRLRKLILPHSITGWDIGEYKVSSGSIGWITHYPNLNVDSLIIDCPNLKMISNGIGNPSFLYIGEGVQGVSIASKSMERLPGASEDSYLRSADSMCIILPKTITMLIGNKRMGSPKVRIFSEICRPDNLYTGSNKWADDVLKNGVIYVPKDTRTYYESSIFKHLEIITRICVQGVNLNFDNVSLKVGDKMKLEAIVSPSDADNKNVSWSSSDNKIAMVDDNGEITALSGGTAVITVTCTENLDVQANCIVEVRQPVESLSVSPKSLSLLCGQKSILMPIILPANADDKTVTWSSSDSNIVKVNEDGNILAISPGIARVYAVSNENAEIKDFCEVAVCQPVTGIHITPSEVNLKLGESVSLTAEVVPDDATNKSVRWSSTNPQICYVNNSGIVTALSAGLAMISAITEDGEYTAECLVISNSIYDTRTVQSTLEVGSSLMLSIIDDSTIETSVNWRSSNPEVAAVDQLGRVWCNAPGCAVITAKCDGIEYSTSFEVKEVFAQSLIVFPVEVVGGIGHQFCLLAHHDPENTTDKTVTWESSDSSIVTVDNDGRVYLDALGSAQITAHSGEHTAICNITVDNTVNISEKAASGVVLDILDKEIIVRNAPLEATIVVYTLDGKAINGAVVEGSETRLRLSSGIYIVKVSPTTIAKVLVK